MKFIIKDTFKAIKSSFSKFLAITCIVMIGVAFFTGIMASPGSMVKSIGGYDALLNLHDVQIISTLGLTDKEIEDIKSQKYVKDVQPFYFYDCYTSIDNSDKVVRLESNDNQVIDKYEIVSGRDVENDNEIILLDSQSGTIVKNFQIGDTIEVFSKDSEISDSISTTTFMVVGFYNDSKYISKILDTSTLGAQQINLIGKIKQDNFVMEAIPSIVLTLNNSSDYQAFSDDYYQYLSVVDKAMEDYYDQLAQSRQDDVISEANDKLNDAREEYNDGLQEFNEKIADAQQEINDGQQEIKDAYQQLVDGQKELDDSKQENIDKLHDAEKEINNGKQQLADGQATLDEQKELALQQLEQAKAQLDSQSEQVNSGIEQLKQGLGETLFGLIEPNCNNIYNQALILFNSGSTDTNTIVGDTTIQQQSGIISTSLYQAFQSNVDIDKQVESLMTSYFSSEEGYSQLYNQLDDTQKLNFPNTLEQFNQLPQVAQDSIKESIRTTLTASITQQVQQQIGEQVQTTTQSIVTAYVGKAGVDYGYSTYQIQKENALQQLEDAQKTIDENAALLVSGSEELIDGWETFTTEIADAQQEIDDGWVDYYDGVNKLKDAQQELDDAKSDGQKELDDAKEKIDDAQKEIDDIDDIKWYVLDRGSHYSSVMYKNTINQMTIIAICFPLFFILVAALVCLTTMTRMVDEQRTLIGTYRSLGFSRLQSCAKFIFYALFASLLGSLIGNVFGLMLFPEIIYNAWGMMYNNPPFQLAIPYTWMIVITLAFTGIMVIITYFTCSKAMKEVPAQLMRPLAPKAGSKTLIERVSFIWNRLSFTMKVTVRNLFRYKKRFFMTVFGVAGCTSLIVCGFGIKNFVQEMGVNQYENIYQFDVSVTFDDADYAGKYEQYKQLDSVDSIYEIYFGNISVKGDSDQSSYIYIGSDDQINNCFNLTNYKSGKSISIDDSGIIISKKLAQYYDAGIGDTLTLENDDGVQAQFVISDICDMNLYHHIFMDNKVYEKAFNESISDNSLALKINDYDAMQNYIDNDNDVASFLFDTTVISFMDNMISGFDIIMVVLVGSAAALAFVVLINLTNVNIGERLREIATLKVLGFTKKEVHHYVYYENIILTFIGSLLGLVFGTFEVRMIMGLINMDNMAFGSHVETISYVYAFVLTIIFAMIVNKIMQRKLDKIAMVESLKSIE